IHRHFNGVSSSIGWNSLHLLLDSDIDYKLMYQDEFENVSPLKAIINEKPAYVVGSNTDEEIQNYTDSIQNAYVQNGQL
ncbi:unnamed protein product, partial [Adineta steineri]